MLPEVFFLSCLVEVVVVDVVVDEADDPRPLLPASFVPLFVAFVFTVVDVVVGTVFKVVDVVDEGEITLPLLSIFNELTVV